MLDVGQGSCVVVDCPDNVRPLLVDCGSTARSARNTWEATTAWMRTALDRLGAPAVVVSHADADHYTLIDDAVGVDGAEAVWLGGERDGYTGEFDQWLDEAAAHVSVSTLPVPYVGPADQDLRCGAAVSDILIANNSAGASKNGDSIVLAVSYEGTAVVLPGDALGATEARALTTRNSLEHLRTAQAIIVGSHHGARTLRSNSLAWAQAWRPYAVAFSMSPDSYRHPTCVVVDRYRGQMTDATPAFNVTCGTSQVTAREVRDRILTTHDNGHILIQIRSDEVMIYCQVQSPACDGPIPSN